MRTRLLLASAAALTLVGCGDSSTTPRLTPTGATREITCRSGYQIATRDDGSEYCAEGDALFAAPGTTTPAATSPATPAAPPAGTPPVATPPVATPPVATPPDAPSAAPNE